MNTRLNVTTSILLLLSLASFACGPAALPTGNGERYVEGEVVVKFKEGADPARTSAAKLRIGVASEARVPLVQASAFLLDGALKTSSALEALHEFSDVVEYAEPNFIYESSGTPSDYDAQVLWGLGKIEAPGAWAATEGSPDVIVAVIDSGVDVYHPDLVNNIWRNTGEIANGQDDDGNGYPDDLHGWDFANRDANPEDENEHGTHVAGTIGAVGGNGGLVGVSPRVKIMALKTLSPYGGSTVAAIQAIDYARQNGAKVINASWGSYGYSNALREAISRAGQAGILFVAASGNGDQYGRGMDADRSPMFPASYDLPNILSVAATDQADRLASFSNYGGNVVHLAAPGEGIASTMPGQQYAYLDGTSMAAPHVAGVAALLIALQPEITVNQLRSILLENTDRISSLSGKVSTSGRLNAKKAAMAAVAIGGGTTTEPAPSNWTWVGAAGGSAHPYANDFTGTWTIKEPGASEVRLRFSNLSTEAGYDFVVIYDGAMNEVVRYDGAKGAFETVSIPGDTAIIRLVTDESITDYGFEVSGFGYR